jgi:serine/threonine-protein kinase
VATPDLREQLQKTLGTAYALERELGGGGMARVFVASETRLGRRVVVKVLPPDLAAGVNAARFEREVAVAATLQHPHIVPVLNAGEAAGVPFYTMPLVEGESLRIRLAREGELPVREAVGVLRDVTRALAYAHARGVVHRDIKPENILLSGGEALVTDFGVAKAIEAAGGDLDRPERAESARDPSTSPAISNPQAGITTAGVALGTPAYMAPEQAAADPHVDARADLYALGCVAYELLTGQPPFAGRGPRQTLAAQVAEAPEPIERRRPNLPPPLSALVMRLLEKRPADRPQSAEEVLQLLDAAATPSGGGEPAVSRAASAPDAIVGTRHRRLALAAGALLALVAGGAALAVRARTASDGSAPAPARAASVAVLPFDNVGGDTADLYFADGMTDELATDLAHVPGLQVAARTSSYAFRGKSADVRSIGKELGVAAVLTGAVRRAGPQLRVTAQLADARTGLVRWSDAYTADSGDVFAVQARLAAAIVQSLAPSFSGTGDKPASAAVAAMVDTSRGTDDREAYDLYLRARHLWYLRGAARLIEAESLFTAATRRDSRFARAYGGLALAYAVSPDYVPGLTYEDVLTPTRRAAERALALDSTQAEAHVALASVLGPAGRWPEAEAHYRRALALNPRSPTAHQWYGLDLGDLAGRVPEALTHLRTAAVLDPLSAPITSGYALALAKAGRRSEVRTTIERALALDSTNIAVRDNAGVALLVLGDARGAVAQYEAARRLGAPGAADYLGRLAAANALAGQRARATAATAQLERGWPGDPARDRELVYAYAGLGDTGRALDALERLVAGGRGGRQLVQYIAHQPLPLWPALRRDPRFAPIRAQATPAP